jgi:hypothetical protein
MLTSQCPGPFKLSRPTSVVLLLYRLLVLLEALSVKALLLMHDAQC